MRMRVHREETMGASAGVSGVTRRLAAHWVTSGRAQVRVARGRFVTGRRAGQEFFEALVLQEYEWPEHRAVLYQRLCVRLEKKGEAYTCRARECCVGGGEARAHLLRALVEGLTLLRAAEGDLRSRALVVDDQQRARQPIPAIPIPSLLEAALRMSEARMAALRRAAARWRLFARRRAAARVIVDAWLAALMSPYTRIGRARLLREFGALAAL